MAKNKLIHYERATRANLATALLEETNLIQKTLQSIIADMGDIGIDVKTYLAQVSATAGDAVYNKKLREKIHVYTDFLVEFEVYDRDYQRMLQMDIINAFLDASGAHMNKHYAERRELTTDGKKKTSVFYPSLLMKRKKNKDKNSNDEEYEEDDDEEDEFE